MSVLDLVIGLDGDGDGSDSCGLVPLPTCGRVASTEVVGSLTVVEVLSDDVDSSIWPRLIGLEIWPVIASFIS